MKDTASAQTPRTPAPRSIPKNLPGSNMGWAGHRLRARPSSPTFLPVSLLLSCSGGLQGVADLGVLVAGLLRRNWIRGEPGRDVLDNKIATFYGPRQQPMLDL